MSIKEYVKKGIKATYNAIPGKRLFFSFWCGMAEHSSALNIPNSLEILQKASPKPDASTRIPRFLEPETLDVSIIVPCYNVERYVSECMESLRQDTSYSYEIIAVDDGSTDGTLKKLNDSAKRDSHIRIIHQENAGVAAARNNAIDYAQGRFLLFVDPDDMVSSRNYLNQLLEEQKKTGAFVVNGSFMPIDNQGVAKKNVADSVGKTGFIWGRLYARSIWEEIRFPEGYWFEDSICSYCILPKYPCTNTGKPIYLYRTRGDSIMHVTKRDPKGVDTYWIAEEMIRLRAELGLPEDLNLYRLLINQFGPMAWARIGGLNEVQKRAFFCQCCSLIEKIGKDKCLTKPDFIERYVELSLKTRNYQLWRRAVALPPLKV